MSKATVVLPVFAGTSEATFAWLEENGREKSGVRFPPEDCKLFIGRGAVAYDGMSQAGHYSLERFVWGSKTQMFGRFVGKGTPLQVRRI